MLTLLRVGVTGRDEEGRWTSGGWVGPQSRDFRGPSRRRCSTEKPKHRGRGRSTVLLPPSPTGSTHVSISGDPSWGSTCGLSDRRPPRSTGLPSSPCTARLLKEVETHPSLWDTNIYWTAADPVDGPVPGPSEDPAVDGGSGDRRDGGRVPGLCTPGLRPSSSTSLSDYLAPLVFRGRVESSGDRGHPLTSRGRDVG